MHRMLLPGGAASAICSAPASVAPPEIPARIPSFVASSRARRRDSAPLTGRILSMSPAAIASWVSLAMKSGLQPCIRCGRKAGWLTPGNSGWGTPLPRIAELSGSHTTMPVSGRSAFSTLATLERAAGAEAGHPVVQALALEGGQDFLRRGARMHVGIGLVLELAAQEPAVLLRQFPGLGEHAAALVGRRRQHHRAPRKRMSLRRSTEKFSAMTTTSG
jgi:hypothetical protein